MYDPSIGKWISADPIGFEGKDTNLYRYVANSPTNAMDPTGTSKESSNDGMPNVMSAALHLEEGEGKYYIIIAMDPGCNFAGGVGHTWVGLTGDTGSTGRMYIGGMGPKTDPDPLGATVPAKIYDDSFRVYVYACAYAINQKEFEAAKKKMQEHPTDYQVRTHNCTTWALSVLQSAGIVLRNVSGDGRAVGSNLCIANPKAKKFVSPQSLYHTLSINPQGAVKCFGKKKGSSPQK